ncbi:TRAP transporter large permease subunit [Vibrio lentus]|nr:TRAP transporter large permease subunit [Vibrio lentus]
MLHMDFFSADILAQSLINGVDSFTLLAIPFFLIAGWKIMASGGLSQRIVRLATARRTPSRWLRSPLLS